MPNFTPGPWHVYHDGYSIAAADGHIVSTDVEGSTDEEAKANARLIAGSRRLYDAVAALGAMPDGYCFCSKDRIGTDSKFHEPECAELRAALKEIEGPPD